MDLVTDESPFSTVEPPVDAQGRHRPVSYWHETVDVTAGEPLDGETDCDVAIIGGGFTGLSTAYELKRAAPDLDVVVLERGVVGHGASGRNGGFAMPLLGWDLSHAAHALGIDRAGKAYGLMYRAVDHLKRLVAERQIDCDLEATGYLLLATCAGAVPHLRRQAELGQRLGFEHRWLEAGELDEHIRSRSFQGGVFDPRPAIINPFKLARGLDRLARDQQARVYEQSPLVALEDGNPLRLRTPRGSLRAKAVVLALNGYGASLGFMASRIVPVHTYIVLTEPLSAADLESIGWSAKRASLETARNFIHYFRLTADNRILFGGEDGQLYWRGRYVDAHRPSFEALTARFREYFPSLAGVEFTHRWGGVLGVTLDMFPTFGVGGDHGTIFHAAGYSGHGVALANYAGVILAPAILKRLGQEPTAVEEEPFFYGRRPPWLPPQALRYVGLQAYRWILRAQDRWRGA